VKCCFGLPLGARKPLLALVALRMGNLVCKQQVGSRESLLHTISPGLIVQRFCRSTSRRDTLKVFKKQKSGIYGTLSLSMAAIYTAQADHIKRSHVNGQCIQPRLDIIMYIRTIKACAGEIGSANQVCWHVYSAPPGRLREVLPQARCSDGLSSRTEILCASS
jgi:hypothetical protein